VTHSSFSAGEPLLLLLPLLPLLMPLQQSQKKMRKHCEQHEWRSEWFASRGGKISGPEPRELRIPLLLLLRRHQTMSNSDSLRLRQRLLLFGGVLFVQQYWMPPPMR
jgi:hypothetical protein